ncbi:MAG: hypothetical protein PGN25_21285 [Methylorubrum populi]
MRIPILAAALLAAATPALAQTAAPPPSSPAVGIGQNNTGGDRNLTIPRGNSAADTVETNSAAGGNSNQPSRVVPQGSAGGGSGGN